MGGVAGNGATAALQALDALERRDPLLHAFVDEPARRERLTAQVAALPAGPLHGVPVGIKDIFSVEGLPTGAGTALPHALFDGPEASAVSRLRAAGAVVLGKTVTTEFAFSAPGPTRNPRNPAHTPGGSSSGSAAAVAAGIVPLAIGTQTVGSVLRPAAFCGVAAFKPTYGRIPTDGVIANAPTFDTVGAFAADLDVLETAMAVLCDTWAPARADRGAVLGVPAGPFLAQVEPAALAVFEERVGKLVAAGHTVLRVPMLPDIVEARMRHYRINLFEFARGHAQWFDVHLGSYRPATVELIRDGRAVSDADYRAALEQREVFARQLAERSRAEGVDVWVSPSALGPAPAGLASTGDAGMNLPWTQARMPVLGLPAGELRGLPLGMQFAGDVGTDEQLVGWSRQWREALG
ncbi:amidase [Pseudonocardia sp. TRM90224]|uniref:amidase n=1 Tax=Pseudonocardia sp. TRM90224 TaxID=2812678 RepID=UPI001E3D3C85|nr:amidase [Pseudonocardia sp. TRM90224]